MLTTPHLPPLGRLCPQIAQVNGASWGGGAAAPRQKRGRPTRGKICQLIPSWWENIRQPARWEEKQVSVLSLIIPPSASRHSPTLLSPADTRPAGHSPDCYHSLD